jgi:hypothetical protein
VCGLVLPSGLLTHQAEDVRESADLVPA